MRCNGFGLAEIILIGLIILALIFRKGFVHLLYDFIRMLKGNI